MAIKSAVVVGAGTVGCAVALLLRRRGVDVSVVEARPDLGTLGSGMLLHGNALRVLREAGVMDQVLASGSEIGMIAIATPPGDIVAEQPDLRSGGPDLPATVGIARPRLHEILTDAMRAAGVRVHAGQRVEHIDQDDAGAAVVTADGQRFAGDVVVIACGLHAHDLRAVVDRQVPQATGWGAWRALLPRPQGLQDRTVLAYGGPVRIAGYAPMGADRAYALLVISEAAAAAAADDRAAAMLEAARPYGGPVWEPIRSHLVAGDADVHFTPFELLRAERWYDGRVVLAGDAAHSFPPTLAQGAAMGLEDGLVLADVLTGPDPLPAALKEYQARRTGRVWPVIEASVHLARLLEEGRQAQAPAVIGRTLGSLVSAP
jgi:2-polyprenyl-6-methoxyphenol hydroxylase-like FAD-dependent oxidoreductase